MKSNLQFIKKTCVLFSLFLFGFFTGQAVTSEATNWLYPTAYTNDIGVVNPENALKGAGDENVALFDNSGDEVTYINFDIPKFPASFQIKGIIVHLYGATSGSRQLNVALTWNDGTNFTTTSYKTNFDIYNPNLGYSYSKMGGAIDLWGHPTWTTDELSNSNFGIRLIADDGEGIAELAEIAIQVFYYVPVDYCNGSAVFAEGIFNVENSQNAVGQPDGNVAVLPPYDRIELDLTGGIGLYRPANSTVTVRWAKTNFTDNNLTVQVQRSLNLYSNTVINTYPVNSSELTEQVIPLAGDARYLIFQYNSSSLSIDAVTYSCSNCPGPLLTPSVTITSSLPDNKKCETQNTLIADFTAIVSNTGEGEVSYLWYYNGIPNYNWNQSTWDDDGEMVDGGRVSCEITVAGTCLSSPTATSNEIITRVYPDVQPTVRIESDDSDNEICSKTEVTFTAIPENTNGGVVSYVWYYNGIPNYNWNHSTWDDDGEMENGDVVSCSITVTNGVCFGIATATSNEIITTVNPFGGTATTTTPTVGLGESAVLTLSDYLGSIQWQYFDPIIEELVNVIGGTGSTSNVYTTPPLTEDTYFIAKVTGGTCSPSYSNEVLITVNPNLIKPSVTITSSDADNKICNKTWVTFTATPSNTGGGTVAFQWMKNGNPLGFPQDTYSSDELYNEEVVSCEITVTGGANLTSTTAISNEIMTNVYDPNLTPSVTIASSDADNEICDETQVTFTATPINTGGGAVSYKWKKNGNPLGANQDTYSSDELYNEDVVSCEITITGAACFATATFFSNEITTTVISQPEPSIIIESSDTDNSICDGTTVTFTATPGNTGTGVITYQWLINKLPVGSNQNTYSSNTLANGDVVSCGVVVTDVICNDEAWAISPEIEMSVEATPVAGTLVMTPERLTVCEGTPVSAVLTTGSGGNGTDELQFRTYDGTEWLEWAAYTSGTDISTAGKTSVEIRTRRLASDCTSSDYNTVTWEVEATPVAGTFAKIPNVATVCEGTDVSAVLTTGSGGDGTEMLMFRTYDGFNWSIFASYTSGAKIGTTGKTAVEVWTRRWGNYCGPSEDNIVSWAVEVNPVPPIIGLITQPTCLVPTGSVLLSGLPSGSWSLTRIPDGTTISGSGASFTVSSLASGTYTFTVTNSSECISPASANVVINNFTALNVIASAGNITTFGGTTTLTATATGGTSPYQYSLNGGAYQSANTFTVSAGTYTVTVKDSKDCTAISNLVTVTQPGQGNTVTYLVYSGERSVHYFDQASLSATLKDSRNRGIKDKTITFTVGSQSTTAKTNRDGVACAKLLIAQFPGSYRILTNFAGDATYRSSSDNDLFTISKKSVTAGLTGTVSKTFDGTAIAYLSPANYTLKGVVNNDIVFLNNPPTGTYNNKNVGIKKAVTVKGLTLTGADAGKYILSSTTVCANIGVITSVQKSASIVTDVQENEGGFELMVYPNPFNEWLRFEFVSPDDVHAQIQVFDVTGRMVKTVFDNPVIGGINYTAEFKPASLVTSMYFYRITLGEKVFVGKVIFKK